MVVFSCSKDRAVSTNVYIDGFNLYHGAVKNTKFKWLDLSALCATLLPDDTIHRIRYFTALVLDFPHDPQASSRQDVYIRALSTIPNLTVHKEGWFATREVWRPKYPLVYLNPKCPPQMVKVQTIEEKRTDVDLAAYLLVDCFFNDFDEAAVISNDSDLTLPIKIVRRVGKRIGVINPHRPRKMSGELEQVASYRLRTINKAVLRNCQFPPTLIDAEGNTITKPVSW